MRAPSRSSSAAVRPRRSMSHGGHRCSSIARAARHHSDRRSTAARARSRRLVDVRGLGSSRFARGIGYVCRRRDVQDVCVRAHQRSSSAAVRARRTMCRVAAGGHPPAAPPDPDKEISTIRLFRVDVSCSRLLQQRLQLRSRQRECRSNFRKRTHVSRDRWLLRTSDFRQILVAQYSSLQTCFEFVLTAK